MNDEPNSVIMVLLFVLRCIIPLGILLGISYLLRRLELIIEPPTQPAAQAKDNSADEVASVPEKPVKAEEAKKPATGAPVPPPAGKKKKKSGKKTASPKRKQKES